MDDTGEPQNRWSRYPKYFLKSLGIHNEHTGHICIFDVVLDDLGGVRKHSPRIVH